VRIFTNDKPRIFKLGGEEIKKTKNKIEIIYDIVIKYDLFFKKKKEKNYSYFSLFINSLTPF
jgi:hypothetical protein